MAHTAPGDCRNGWIFCCRGCGNIADFVSEPGIQAYKGTAILSMEMNGWKIIDGKWMCVQCIWRLSDDELFLLTGERRVVVGSEEWKEMREE